MVILLAAICVSTPSAAADSASPETALIVQGTDRLKAGDYEGAREAFASAYEIRPASATLLKLGMAELESGHPVDAARHLRSYVARPDAPPGKVQAIVTKWLPNAEARTSRLRIDAPPGVEVVVDGHVEGRAPLGLLDVAVGKHDVTVRDGSWSQSREVTTAAGAPPEHIEFQRAAAPSAPSPPANSIAAIPHPATDSRSSRAKLIAVVATGSAALIATGLGIAFAVANKTNEHDANTIRKKIRNLSDNECQGATLATECSILQRDLNAQNQDYHLALALYLGGATFAAVALTTWLLWPTARGENRNGVGRLVPIVGQDRAGLALGGQW